MSMQWKTSQSVCDMDNIIIIIIIISVIAIAAKKTIRILQLIKHFINVY